MHSDLDSTFALLERTPAALNALLRGLPEPWTSASEGQGTWGARDIVGHLIHCERTDWMPRARSVLQSEELRVFPPFDRFGHLQAIADKPLDQLLDEFAALRQANLTEARAWNLTPSQRLRSGLHPALGQVTLDELLAAWAAHDLNHLHQMARVLAFPYRAAIGPFKAYMGVMHCTAHGS